LSCEGHEAGTVSVPGRRRWRLFRRSTGRRGTLDGAAELHFDLAEGEEEITPDNNRLLVDEAQGSRSVFALALLSVVVGAWTGLVGASFRLLLRGADGWRTEFIAHAHRWGLSGSFIVVGGIAIPVGLGAGVVVGVGPQAGGTGVTASGTPSERGVGRLLGSGV